MLLHVTFFRLERLLQCPCTLRCALDGYAPWLSLPLCPCAQAGAEARFIRINHAYQTLSDSQQRAEYDRELRGQVC
jgi:hypothetical protein